MNLFNIGFGNLISPKRVIAVLSPDSAPIKRLVHVAKEKNLLIDSTCGRKTKSVFVMDSNHVILSALGYETLMNKIVKECAESKADI